jgi:hypothetical protein
MTTRAPTSGLNPRHATSWRMTLKTLFSVHTLRENEVMLDAPLPSESEINIPIQRRQNKPSGAREVRGVDTPILIEAPVSQNFYL